MTTTNPDQTIFVTGGTGFLGRAILRTLRSAHPTWRVISYDLNLPHRTESVPGVEYSSGDILNTAQTTSAVLATSPSAVIHTAGIVTPIAQRYSKSLRPLVHKVNIDGTRSMLAIAQSIPSVHAFVWTGSCCAVIDDFRHQYPNIDESWMTSPTEFNTIYGESKAIAETSVLDANDPTGSTTPSRDGKTPFLTCSLRPSTLFGDSDSQLLSGIHAMIARHETPFIIGDATNLWDVCHAANVADAHLLAVENLLTGDRKAAGEAFFIGNEEPITFRDFCLAIWREFGHVPPFEVRVPQNLAWGVGWVMEWVSWVGGFEPSLRRESVSDACAVRYASGDKARRILGYKAKLSLDEGIRRSCRLHKERLERKPEEVREKNTE